MGRWCDCKEPKTRGIAYRRCLNCGKLVKLSQGVKNQIAEEKRRKNIEAKSKMEEMKFVGR